MWDSGKWETFSERSKERRSARKISRCARNDSVGEWISLYRIKCALGKCSSCITISRYARNDRVENEYPVHHTKNVWETRSSRIVIPSEAEGSSLHSGKTVSLETAVPRHCYSIIA